MKRRALVLDANIWLRAVLGQRVREYLLASTQDVMFFAPDVAYADAKNYRPGLLEKRRIPAIQAMTVLDQLERVVRPLDAEFYQPHQADALRRIASRDTDDWPILACSLALDCPVRTEDTDFFDAGVATWTTERVSLYLV